MADSKQRVKSDLSVLHNVQKDAPNILFIIERSKNKNIVVYEAKLAAEGKLDTNYPIEAYWLDIDPAYVAANRKKGIMTDRSELNMIESKFAYGLSVQPTGKENEYKVTLVAVPSRTIILHIDADGEPKARIIIDGKECHFKKIYVDSTDRFMMTPKVNFVELHGVHFDSGDTIVEKIIP